ncbi:MAG TPA: hypothetical protein VFJ82_13995 [Longimicrobium sp.]|nr:hypothetical protein [Longimicrobium sp.]
MKKVKLDVDTLAVESFPTAASAEQAGTVQGFDAPTPPYASCGCTTGASYLEAFCPPPISNNTCAA